MPTPTSRSPRSGEPATPSSPNKNMPTSEEPEELDPNMEADKANAQFTSHREKNEVARKAMLEEVERIIKLIRHLKRQVEQVSVMAHLQTESSAEIRTKSSMVQDMVTATLYRFPEQYVPVVEGKDEMGRLADAINIMVTDMEKAEVDVTKTKQHVHEITKQMNDLRIEADKLQNLLDDSTHHLRDAAGDTGGKMVMPELIELLRQLIEDESKAKDKDAEGLETEKKYVDGMLDRRRQLVKILQQLFERCGDVDRLTKEIGLPSATARPKDVDEKTQMAAEFERAIGWLIGQVSALINELRSTRRRLADSRDKLERSEKDSKNAAYQLAKCQENLQTLKDKADDLKKRLDEAKDTNVQTKKEAEDMRTTYEQQEKELLDNHDEKKLGWNKMDKEFADKELRLRSDLDNVHSDLSHLRKKTSELTERVDRSLNEYIKLKKTLLGGVKNGNGRIDREKEALIRKLHADLAAMEAATKEAERETDEWEDEAKEAKDDMDRRSGWRDGAKNRLDTVKGQREKEGPVLTQLKDEEARLQQRTKDNAQKLKASDNQMQEMHRRMGEVGRKLQEVQNENQQLRWDSEEYYPNADKNEPGQCPKCAQREAAMRSSQEPNPELPELQRQLSQYKKMKHNMEQQAAKVREELEKKKDRIVKRKGDKPDADFKQMPPSTATEDYTDSSHDSKSEEPPRSEMLGRTTESPAIRKRSSLPKRISQQRGQQMTYRRSTSTTDLWESGAWQAGAWHEGMWQSMGGGMAYGQEEHLNLIVNANVLVEASEQSSTTATSTTAAEDHFFDASDSATPRTEAE